LPCRRPELDELELPLLDAVPLEPVEPEEPEEPVVEFDRELRPAVTPEAGIDNRTIVLLVVPAVEWPIRTPTPNASSSVARSASRVALPGRRRSVRATAEPEGPRVEGAGKSDLPRRVPHSTQ
jgi:hypothetical protein